MLDSWDGQFWETAGSDTAASTSTTLTGGSANVKGSWVQLIASTAHDAVGLLVTFDNSTANARVLIDVGVGGAGSEQVIIPNLGAAAVAFPPHQYLYFPIAITAGSRIAARCQSSSASGTGRCSVLLLSGGLEHPAPLDHAADYGTVTASSILTSIDPGGSANTKGSWVELTSATIEDIRALGLIAHVGSNTAPADANWLVDIGIGGAGSEQVLLPNLRFSLEGVGTSADFVSQSAIGCFPCQIPAGTRIAARCQCSITDATDRLIGVGAYGVA